ncbi:MAG: sugar ABC transporter substrate-binding protein [Clostridia bacterium]|jgi:ribose transport system substrate-binding protein|nr:sugar ABC transporter substrate-binding protein [Clostridia bacterium]MBT7121557.1 sugar ABC transporter substrate-binding protein [Clostridia bacterium]
MKKVVRLLVLVLVVLLAFAACNPAVTPEEVQDVVEDVVEDVVDDAEDVVEDVVEDVEDVVAMHTNAADFDYQEAEGTVFDLNGYYNPLGVECDVTIRATGGTVNVPDGMTDAFPTANEAYTIGFSVYYTVDEVGSMILDTMEAAALEAGVTLLVNDANYDQNAQNTAIEQWILQDVDGVILAPCDFYGVKESLDALKEAGIPVVTLNPPLAGEADAVTSFDCVVQGQQAGEMLEAAIMDAGIEMKGTIVWQNLPFVHPNAATRALGFLQVFEKYPDVELIELTGISPEDHYTAFEGALAAHPDMIGAWGLYSSATIGMMNAKLAADSDVLLSSVDNDKLILKGIYDGDIVGSACYSSIWPARWTMSQMINLLNGVEIPGLLYGANMAVTPDNVEEAFELYYPGQTLAGFMAGTE